MEEADKKIVSLDVIKNDPRYKRPSVFLQRGTLADSAISAETELVKLGVAIFRSATIIVEPTMYEVEASHGRKATAAGIREVSASRLRYWMSKLLSFRRYNKERQSYYFVDPPPEIADYILEQKESKFKPVTSVMTAPTMRPDGTVLWRPGYDATTGIYMIDPPEIKIPENPTYDEAKAALATLNELLIEFPFTSGASRSVALSGILSCVVRAAISRAPMHMVSATTAGTGKSYLVDICSTIASGFHCPVISAGRTEEEMEKRLGAAIVMGRPFVSIDNVNGILAGDFLCQAIERPQTDVRILGKTQLVRVHNSVVIFSTGNNIQPSGDVVRRSIVCRLDAGIERPELRRFERDPLLHAGANRSKYLEAALTITRAYIVAGKPGKLDPLASFTEWSDLVRSSLVWLGEADPVDSIATARQSDPEFMRISAMLEALEDAGFNEVEHKMLNPTAAGILAAAAGNRELREALASIGYRGELPNSRALGNWLTKHKDRVVNGMRLITPTANNKHAKVWYVQRMVAPSETSN